MEWENEVEIEDVSAIGETDMALLCRINDRERWIPKSQISDNSEVWEKVQEGTLIISPWFAEKEGIV